MTRKIMIAFVFILIAGISSACSAISPQPAQPDELQATIPESVEPTKPVLPAQTPAATPTLAEISTEEPGDLATCTPLSPLAPGDDHRIVNQGISFVLDPALGDRVNVQECPAVPGPSGADPWAVHPAYISFTFLPERQRVRIQPELRVYTVEGDMQNYLYPLNALEDLQSAISQQPEPVTWFDGTVLHVHRNYLSFASGKGVRGVVERAQDYFFYLNNNLLYEFDGMTDDGQFYINFHFPVAAPFLLDMGSTEVDPAANTNPQAIEIPKWNGDYEELRKLIEDYNSEALQRFDQAVDEDFTPNLQLLDSLISSLTIESD